jgi:hypothetical protein
MRRRRILAAAVAAAAVSLPGAPAAASPEYGAPAAPASRLNLSHDVELAPGATHRLRTASWWGGRITAATGEQVTVNISSSYPEDDAVAQAWADFFAGLIHGPELASVNVYVAPLDEVAALCNAPALGCYGANRLVTVGEETRGIQATSVAAHEYGHHVAAHRANPPWRALHWGTKRWATAMGICTRHAEGTVFPGDEGRNYALNPGEAFAESYRLLNERRADPTLATWPIVHSSLFPSGAALKAVEDDVVRPWTAPTSTLRRARFVAGRARAWTQRVATPLDGELQVTLDLPPAMPYRLSVRDARGRVVARGTWSSARRQTTSFTVCGHRTVTLRVERNGPPARFVLRVQRP